MSNKGIELVRFARILRRFKNKIPEDFKFKEPPTVVYTRSPTIGQKIFNYKQTIESIKSEDWKSENFSCHCKDRITQTCSNRRFENHCK